MSPFRIAFVTKFDTLFTRCQEIDNPVDNTFRNFNFCTSIWWSMKSNSFLKSNKTALIVAPLPSVALFHECSMLIKAWVLLRPGIVPNWREATFLRTACFTKPSTTKSSAAFYKMGVNDMRLKWLFTSRIGFCFGIGEMLASFHDNGRRATMYEQFNDVRYW